MYKINLKHRLNKEHIEDILNVLNSEMQQTDLPADVLLIKLLDSIFQLLFSLLKTTHYWQK